MTITRFISRVIFIAAAIAVAAVLTGPAASAAPLSRSISQCDSGYFCIWSGANYAGSFQQFSATSSYRTINLTTVNSLYNRRADRTYLHEATDGSEQFSCYGPGVKVANLSGWRENAEAVWLSTVTNC